MNYRGRHMPAGGGFTLLELVVVIVILTLLAGMILPKFDFLADQAEQASGAATQVDLSTAIRTHKISTAAYPCLDLLIDTSNAVYTGPSGSATTPGGVWADTIGGVFQPRLVLPFTVPADYAPSLYSGGLTLGYRHLPTATDASNSTGEPGTNPALSLVSAVEAGTLVMAQLNPNTEAGAKIINTIYPLDGVVPTGTTLVVMGVGGRNAMLGHTLETVPMDLQRDDSVSIYCRYLAVFSIYASDHPAQLKLIVDHRGQQIQRRLELYKEYAPDKE